MKEWWCCEMATAVCLRMEVHAILTVPIYSLVGFETWKMAGFSVKVADDAAEVVYQRVDCFRDKNAKT